MSPRRLLKVCSLDWGRSKDPKTPLGVASIAAYLKSIGTPCEIGNFAVNAQPTSPSTGLGSARTTIGPHPHCSSIDIVHEVVEFARRDADKDTVFAMGAFVWAEDEVQGVLRSLKAARFPGTVVLGGPHVRQDIQAYRVSNLSSCRLVQFPGKMFKTSW